jgi:hypothetical protein
MPPLSHGWRVNSIVYGARSRWQHFKEFVSCLFCVVCLYWQSESTTEKTKRLLSLLLVCRSRPCGCEHCRSNLGVSSEQSWNINFLKDSFYDFEFIYVAYLHCLTKQSCISDILMKIRVRAKVTLKPNIDSVVDAFTGHCSKVFRNQQWSAKQQLITFQG